MKKREMFSFLPLVNSSVATGLRFFENVISCIRFYNKKNYEKFENI